MPTLLRSFAAPRERPVLSSERETIESVMHDFVRAARALSLRPGIIPLALRRDLAVLHGFCRLLDNSVDEAASRIEASEALQRLVREWRGLEPARPMVALLRERLDPLGIDPELIDILIAGIEGDLAQVQVGDDAEFVQYAYRVAGTVAIMLCRALGVRESALPFAVDLGIAMQCTNVARDWRADAKRGRVYLPLRRLCRAGIAPERLLLEADARPRAMQLMLERFLALGDQYYASAERGIGAVPLRYRHGVMVMARIYRREGWRAVRGFRGSGPGRMSTPVWERAGIMAVVALRSILPSVLGIGSLPEHDPARHTAIAGWPGTDAHADPPPSIPAPPPRPVLRSA